jgi:hypothetical protein
MFAGLMLLPTVLAMCHPFVLAPAIFAACLARRYWWAALCGSLGGLCGAGIVAIFHRPGLTFFLFPPPGLAWMFFPFAGFILVSICYPLVRFFAGPANRRVG